MARTPPPSVATTVPTERPGPAASAIPAEATRQSSHISLGLVSWKYAHAVPFARARGES